MIDLKNYCGLEVGLDTKKPGLSFVQGVNFSNPAVRILAHMQEMLLDKNIDAPEEFYYMYRDVYSGDKLLLEKYKLRYDLTVIKPHALGREFMKTAGHYHPNSFGELYEVVHGRCFCLLQRPNQTGHRIIEEVILVSAAAGQKIVIPPYFGHILINPGPEYLVTSNWVSSVFSSEYDLYKKARGAAYFVIKGSSGNPEYLVNPYFTQVAKIKFKNPAKIIESFGLEEAKPIYKIINQNPEKLDFLNRPLDFDYRGVFV